MFKGFVGKITLRDAIVMPVKSSGGNPLEQAKLDLWIGQYRLLGAANHK
jgi:hypothetical protein